MAFKIYLFTNGFNHSKVISIDGDVSIIGSANMDSRSFEHNFEVMSVIYNSDCTKVVEGEFLENIKKCEQIELKSWKKRPVKDKLREGVFRLLAPLI